MAEIIDEDGHKYSYKVIVIEGPDGVGKTTFSANFVARLRRHDHPYIRHHFPNKTCWHSEYLTNGELKRWGRGSTPVARPLQVYRSEQRRQRAGQPVHRRCLCVWEETGSDEGLGYV